MSWAMLSLLVWSPLPQRHLAKQQQQQHYCKQAANEKSSNKQTSIHPLPQITTGRCALEVQEKKVSPITAEITSSQHQNPSLVTYQVSLDIAKDLGLLQELASILGQVGGHLGAGLGQESKVGGPDRLSALGVLVHAGEGESGIAFNILLLQQVSNSGRLDRQDDRLGDLDGYFGCMKDKVWRVTWLDIGERCYQEQQINV